MFEVQRDDDFTITVGLEVVRGLEMLSQDSVVVDLAIDGQSHCTLIVDQRLGAAVHADDTKSFVAEYGVVPSPVARPVGTTMPQAFDALKSLGFKGGYRRMAVKRNTISYLRSSKRNGLQCMAWRPVK